MTEEPKTYLATRLSSMGMEERVTALESRVDSLAVTQRSILDGVDQAAAERADMRNRPALHALIQQRRIADALETLASDFSSVLALVSDESNEASCVVVRNVS